MTDRKALELIDGIVSGDGGMEAECYVCGVDRKLRPDYAKDWAKMVVEIYKITHPMLHECCGDRNVDANKAMEEILEEFDVIGCIQSGCDLNGTVPGVDGEPEPCQYCHEMRFPTIKLIKQAHKVGYQVGLDWVESGVDKLRAGYCIPPKECDTYGDGWNNALDAVRSTGISRIIDKTKGC